MDRREALQKIASTIVGGPYAAPVVAAAQQIAAMKLYRPLVSSELSELWISRICLCRGGNRSGLTLPGAVEVARAITQEIDNER